MYENNFKPQNTKWSRTKERVGDRTTFSLLWSVELIMAILSVRSPSNHQDMAVAGFCIIHTIIGTTGWQPKLCLDFGFIH